MADDDKPPPHPGRTPAQRRVLDAIGCGNHSPIMAVSTRDALLKAGLIELCGSRVVGAGWFAVQILEYDMPIPVHMAWCAAVSHGVTDEELNDAVGK